VPVWLVGEKDVDACIAPGFTTRNVRDVKPGVATKVMSNHTNPIAHTPMDAFMKGKAWTKPEFVPA
jgi:hypothetical protein